MLHDPCVAGRDFKGVCLACVYLVGLKTDCRWILNMSGVEKLFESIAFCAIFRKSNAFAF